MFITCFSKMWKIFVENIMNYHETVNDVIYTLSLKKVVKETVFNQRLRK